MWTLIHRIASTYGNFKRDFNYVKIINKIINMSISLDFPIFAL